MWPDLGLLLTAAALGGGGAVHCAGMCSAPVAFTHRPATITLQAAVTPQPVSRLPFHVGRTLSYSLAGGLAGAASWPLMGRSDQPWSTLLLVLLIVGVCLGSQVPVVRQLLHQVYCWFTSRIQPLTRVAPMTARWLLGMVWVLLPCGLLHAALALALLSGTAERGAMIGLVFALSSSWGLVAGDALWRFFGRRVAAKPHQRRWVWMATVAVATGLLWLVTPHIDPANPWWCATTPLTFW
jgi:uncharacterized protein